MPLPSELDILKKWRYSVKKEFTSPSGELLTYAPNGHRVWGEEDFKLTFPKPVSAMAINCDRTLIAFAVGEDIHIHETSNFSPVVVCRGHASTVDFLDFQPGNPNVLVSSAEAVYRGDISKPKEAMILFWDLDEEKNNSMLDPSGIHEIVTQATKTVAKGLLEAAQPFELSISDEEIVIAAIKPVLTRIIKTHKVAGKKSLYGRLRSAHQYQNFTPSGSHLIYMPGETPHLNGKVVRDFRLCSMTTYEDTAPLSGHSGHLMWIGYSPDGSMIGTNSWDHVVRICDFSTGKEIWKFETNGPSWMGGFSPDSKKFAGTCGDGNFDVYSLVDGSTIVRKEADGERSRVRSLDWAPDSNIIAVGEESESSPGRVFLFDVEKKEVTQERILSFDRSLGTKEDNKSLLKYLKFTKVQFIDGGKKLVSLASGDGGVEVRAWESWQKWRFARPGVDISDGSEEIIESGEQIEGTSLNDLIAGSEWDLQTWEDPRQGKIWIASSYGDAVRVWSLPMSAKE